MKLRFTKMHGLGNDFVVIDATRAPVDLTPARVKAIADRHFGVGCDQLLVVEPAGGADVDFRYRIFNADGGAVEQCGNGARCFVRFVHDRGLTDKAEIRVETRSGIIAPRLRADGRRSRQRSAGGPPRPSSDRSSPPSSSPRRSHRPFPNALPSPRLPGTRRRPASR